MKKIFLLLFFVAFVAGCSFQSPFSCIGQNPDEFASIVDCYCSNVPECEAPLSYCYSLSSSSSYQSTDDSHLSNYCVDPFYVAQIENKMSILANLKTTSSEYDVFTFYTDHHCFVPSGRYDVDTALLESQFELIEEVQNLSDSMFVMCGGDLLQNYDTKSQACFKLATYISLMDRFFGQHYILVGNHDTNCQGQDYINLGDYTSCVLSQETINDIFYNGGNSYYKITTTNTSFYCFDSGIDWFAFDLSEYQKEQLSWFADSLLNDDRAHKAIFIHIALVRYESTRVLTSMISEIGRIIEAFNNNGTVIVNGDCFDYASSNGKISFIQAGHSHIDLNTLCGGVPTIITTSFASQEAVSRPTFDVVFVDYTNQKLYCLRIGDGDDRFFDIC